MASDTGHKPSRMPRRIGAGLAILAAMLALLLAAGGWLLGSESGARAAFSMLEALAPGVVRAEGIHGRLAGPLQLDGLTLDSAGQLVTLENTRLDWQPRALLSGQVHVNLLHVDKLSVMHKVRRTSEPARLPDNIALPFKLRADSVQVGRGDIMLGPVNLVELGPLAFNADFDGSRYLLRVERLAARSGAQAGSIAGNFKGEATLSASKPYALRAEFSSGAEAVVGEQTFGAAGRIGAEGSLAEMAVTADLAINKSKIAGRAVLRPFSEQPLGVTGLAAQAVDLSAFRQDLPRTRLDITLSIAETGAGQLALANADAGLYNDKKLPLADLRIAFRQHAGEIDVDKISATLGDAKHTAGAITGQGRYAHGALTLDLSLKALDLRRLDQRMQPTQLAGRIGLRHAGGRQEFTVDLTEPLNNKQNVALVAHGALAGSALNIDQAELRLGNGRVHVAGHLDLADRQSFSATGDVARFRLKDVGNFAQLPDLFLNGHFSLRGARQPQLLADLAFDIVDSRLQGYPLQGAGKAQLRADGIDISRFLLAAGANRLSMQGRLTQNEGQLSFALSAPKLEQLGPGFSGALEANGVARGSFRRPHITANWNGSSIRISDVLRAANVQGKMEIQVDRDKPFFVNTVIADAQANSLQNGSGKNTQQVRSLSAQLHFSPQPNAPLNLAIRGEGVVAGGIRADSFVALANGTTAQHEISLSVTEPGQNWTLNAGGGLKALESAPQWQGSIQRFDAVGRFAGHLVAPAPLLVSQQRVQLDRFRLDAAVAYIAVEQFLRDRNGVVTRGSIERLQIGQLLKFSGQEPALTTDLQLHGEWDVNLTDAPSGTVRIRREGGDIIMRGSRPVALGLSRLEATANASNGELTVQLRADGKQLGVIDANGKISIAGGNRLVPAPAAPVSADIKIDIPSLGWTGPLISPTTIVEGRVQSAITVGGTLSQPVFGGKINGNALRFLSVEAGIDLRQGVLESEFQGSQLVIRNLRFPSGDGQLTATGLIDLADRQPGADIAVKAERFAVLDRSDRRLRVSGASRISWREARAKITGAFTVDSGFLDITSTSMPRLSDDVVIVGRNGQKRTERGLPAAIDVAIDLGNGIVLKGRGLDALLGGQIRLTSAPGEPLRAGGTLHIVKGTFSAYGRDLAIEQGLLRFNGPIDNPSLDVLAMRRGQEVEAGVAVRGTVLSPRVTLVSEPPVSDAEKLSWLVLGHGLETAGQSDLSKLQSSAGALLSQGAAAGVESQIARAFGLDQFSVGSTTQDGLEQRIVTLGKQISSRLYVSVEQGLQTASSVLHMRYTLGSKLTLEAEAGTRSALSLFYNISFD
jgi:translocation and assembly module TamB